MRKFLMGLFLFLATTTPALAATETGGDSVLGCWLFLGFVAVLFVVQGIPVLMMLFGIAKSLFTFLPHEIKAK